jgi:monoterpene epsilon-lactone hydrolase
MASRDIETIRALLEAEQTRGPLNLVELRKLYDGSTPMYPVPEGITIEPVDAGGVPAERVSGAVAVPGRTILYLHGGGYVIGSPVQYRHLAGAIVEAAQATLVMLDYRLAPEHPYPAAVEDALAAYRRLLEQGQNPAQLIVAGDSAGGGLTVSTLIRARDEGLALPAAAVLISPWTDLAHTGDTLKTLAGRDPSFDEAVLVEMADHYLGGVDPTTPLASPLYADLSGLPPLLIQVGAEEMLLDDSVRLDRRAREHGVESVLEVWEEMVHSWHFYYPQLEEGRAAILRLGAFIRAAVGSSTGTASA